MFYDKDRGKVAEETFSNNPGWVGVDVSKRTQDGTAPKSQMLYAMHPDVTRLALRWGRPHHYVDYAPFAKNRLRLKSSVALPEGDDEFGMVQESLAKHKVRRTAPSVSTDRGRREMRVDATLGKEKSIRVHFNSQEDMDKFAEITGLRVARDGAAAWFPPAAETSGIGLMAMLQAGGPDVG